MIDETKPIITGVCAVVANPDGVIVETYADFSRSGYGGFTLAEAQEIRAKTVIKGRFAASHLNGWLSSGMDSYFVEKFWDNAQRAGYRLHVFPASDAEQTR